MKPEYGEGRDGKEVQIGHTFDIQFKMKIVKDNIVWEDPDNKSKGYKIKSGSTKKKTPVLDVSSKIGVSKKKFPEMKGKF